MKNSKLFALILAAAIAVFMTACGNAASGASAEVSSASAASMEASASVTAEASAAPAASTTAADSTISSIADLYAQGYTMGASTYDGSILKVNFVNADHTDFLRAECPATQEQVDEFFAIDFFAEDYDQQCRDFLAALPDLTIESMNDSIPGSEELDAYVGRTIGELENEGFEFAGYNDDEDGKLVVELYSYVEDSDDAYVIRVYPEGEPEDDGSYDDETILTLVIGRIFFWDFA